MKCDVSSCGDSATWAIKAVRPDSDDRKVYLVCSTHVEVLELIYGEPWTVVKRRIEFT